MTSASVNGITDPSPAWKHGRWRRNLSVSFDLLCIDQQRSTDISESCITGDGQFISLLNNASPIQIHMHFYCLFFTNEVLMFEEIKLNYKLTRVTLLMC